LTPFGVPEILRGMKTHSKSRPFSILTKQKYGFALVGSLLLLAGSSLVAAQEKVSQRDGSSSVPYPVFTDVTAAAGLEPTGFPFGDPIWGDSDGDGDLDLFVDNHFNMPPYFYLNNGDGTFTDIFTTTGIYERGDRHGSGWCDFDNDGDLDLHITKGANNGHGLGTKSDDLLLNIGGNMFLEIAGSSGATDTWGRGRSVAWGDYNNDGLPDLLLGNLKTNLVLYQNQGDGTFTDVAPTVGLANLHFNEVDFADYNNDGFPDIYCSDVEERGAQADRLYKNNGDGTYTEVTRTARIKRFTNGRSLAWGDYNNDGYLDIFISRGTDVAMRQTLYRNKGNGTFVDATDQAGLGAINNDRGAAWGDFDNDGYLDLYVVNSGTDPGGKGPNFLFHNNGNGTFTDVAADTGVQSLVLSRGRGCAWGDYDNDGFLDLFVTNGEDNTDYPSGPQFLFHNERNSNHWLKIKLIGTLSNRQALGTKVTITIGQQIQYRENNGSMGHYLSQGATPVHFGLGTATTVDQLFVQWPSGLTTTLSGVAADQELVLTEGQ
jgi:hypothetical protein